MEPYIKIFALNLLLLFGFQIFAQKNLSYPIVDTDQQTSYNNLIEISPPNIGEDFMVRMPSITGFNPAIRIMETEQ